METGLHRSCQSLSSRSTEAVRHLMFRGGLSIYRCEAYIYVKALIWMHGNQRQFMLRLSCTASEERTQIQRRQKRVRVDCDEKST
jgi:hypothetical protein